MGILIFKGLTARRLYKSFGVKELNNSALLPDLHKGVTLSTSTIHNTLLFTDDHNGDSEDKVQTTVFTLKNITKILEKKPPKISEAMVF
jgi:hypothetical protein